MNIEGGIGVSTKEKSKLRKLDLGAGEFVREGYECIDLLNYNPLNKHKFKPDIQCDLNEGIPVGNNSCEAINMSHFLEHVDNPYFMLEEIRRVCVKDSEVDIRVPLFDIAQPCHKTCFYDDWFERNIMPTEFEIIKKEVTDKTVVDPCYGDRSFKELRVILKVIK